MCTSKCQIKIEKLKSKCKIYLDSNNARLEEKRLLNAFIKKLLDEGRISKEELKPYAIRKKMLPN